jgi:predicted nucleic acid-binding Zn ribbon protein
MRSTRMTMDPLQKNGQRKKVRTILLYPVLFFILLVIAQGLVAVMSGS